MKAYSPLRNAFKDSGMTTPGWCKSTRFPKSMETVNSIVYRDAIVDASTLAYFACCLELPNKKTVEILEQYALEVPKKQAEVNVLKRLIVNHDFTKEEQDLIHNLRSMDKDRRKLVYELVKKLD